MSTFSDGAVDWWRRRGWTSPKIRGIRRFDSMAALPEQLPRRVLAIAGDPPAWVVMECPCGRGHRLKLRIRPHGDATVWTLTHTDAGPSLIPSVDFDSPERRCHFWLRNGRVKWVRSP